jgi:hypothetical protein
MKLFILCVAILLHMSEAKEMTTNQFQAVWNDINTTPYTKLPHYKVSVSKLFTWSKNIILNDAKRTLKNRADILPSFEKLAHSNGICLKGSWQIHTDNPYSGYFKPHSKALIIARVSSAMSNTKSGEIRAFGLAAKLFPTTNPLQINKEPSANFFAIDDLGGTKAKYFSDVTLTNAPKVSTNSEVLKHILYALQVAKAFSDADSHSEIRQLYEISELGEKGKVVTPKWIKISTIERQSKDAIDFRVELTLQKGEKLILSIAVAHEKKSDTIQWQTIGSMTFDSSVVSEGCDKRLHFHHPKWKED